MYLRNSERANYDRKAVVVGRDLLRKFRIEFHTRAMVAVLGTRRQWRQR